MSYDSEDRYAPIVINSTITEPSSNIISSTSLTCGKNNIHHQGSPRPSTAQTASDNIVTNDNQMNIPSISLSSSSTSYGSDDRYAPVITSSSLTGVVANTESSCAQPFPQQNVTATSVKAPSTATAPVSSLSSSTTTTPLCEPVLGVYDGTDRYGPSLAVGPNGDGNNNDAECEEVKETVSWIPGYSTLADAFHIVPDPDASVSHPLALTMTTEVASMATPTPTPTPTTMTNSNDNSGALSAPPSPPLSPGAHPPASVTTDAASPATKATATMTNSNDVPPLSPQPSLPILACVAEEEEVVLIASTSSTSATDNIPVRENNTTIYEMMLNDADDTNFTSDEIVGDFFKELHDDGSSKSGINNIVDEFYKESHEQRPSSFDGNGNHSKNAGYFNEDCKFKCGLFNKDDDKDDESNINEKVFQLIACAALDTTTSSSLSPLYVVSQPFFENYEENDENIPSVTTTIASTKNEQLSFEQHYEGGENNEHIPSITTTTASTKIKSSAHDDDEYTTTSSKIHNNNGDYDDDEYSNTSSRSDYDKEEENNENVPTVTLPSNEKIFFTSKRKNHSNHSQNNNNDDPHGYTIAGKYNLAVNTTIDSPTADALSTTLESHSPLYSPPEHQKQQRSVLSPKNNHGNN